MKIETKFNVNDIVKFKYETISKSGISVLEIKEIISHTCYTGTQNFCLCRPIVMRKEYENEYKKEGNFEWVIYHHQGKKQSIGWHKYREDELKKLSKDELKEYNLL
jgi:hypothetical protein